MALMPLLCFVLLTVNSVVYAEETNFANVDCGVSRALRHGRIVGGQDAAQGEFPWLVSLTRSGGHFCGGTIVNSRWVLTAAHCLCRDELGISSLRVTLGEHDLRQRGEHDLPVSRVILHPRFRCGQYGDDIALVELGSEVPWSVGVLPACFPLPGVALGHQADVMVAGWGWTEESSSKGIRSNVLQKVNLSVVENAQCRDWYRSQGKKLEIRDTQMCAGLEQGGKDACWADSGGPLMSGDARGVTVVGVVSTGIGCARPRLPGLYTRVSEFLPWISASIGDSD
ncbi:hypothetical protein J6590_059921 [Homalodisca vitripennis]|nr:hypothetical protein J6590_059921 [Homalodisca vitripennis]